MKLTIYNRKLNRKVFGYLNILFTQIVQNLSQYLFLTLVVKVVKQKKKKKVWQFNIILCACVHNNKTLHFEVHSVCATGALKIDWD